jgi:hypothetical protein
MGVTMKKPQETLIILRQAANTLNAKAVPVQAYSFDDFICLSKSMLMLTVFT